MLWDTHMHCYFSGDSDADPEEMIKAAQTAGLDGICFTDHLDYDFPADPPDLFLLDPDAYDREILALSKKYDFKSFIISCSLAVSKYGSSPLSSIVGK